MADTSLSDAAAIELLAIAAGAAEAGGAVLRRQERGNFAARGIDDRDIKLAEDKLSEERVTEYLRAHSKLPILSEEAGWQFGRAEDGQPYWVVDPLDGSFNYYRGIPLCCVSVAVCIRLRPLLGAILDFNRNELFAGGPQLKTTINGLPPATDAGRNEVLATGFPVRGGHDEAAARAIATQTANWKKIRMLGSAALSLAWVAAGRIDGYEEHGIMLWDVAAGVALALGNGFAASIKGECAEKPLDVRVAPRLMFA